MPRRETPRSARPQAPDTSPLPRGPAGPPLTEPPPAAPRGGDVALSLARELARKGIHLVTALAPLAYAAGVGRLPLAVVLGAAAAVALTVELARVAHAPTRGIFQRMAGPLLRAHEHVRWAGATWLFVAFLGAVLLLPREVAITAMWAVAVGDAAAAVVGRSVGHLRLAGSAKTIEGSMACWSATFVGAVLVAHLPMGEGVVAASAAALAEWPAGVADDNIRIAAAVGGAILLWRLSIASLGAG